MSGPTLNAPTGELFTGWGRTNPSRAVRLKPSQPDEAVRLLSRGLGGTWSGFADADCRPVAPIAGDAGAIPRGLGRSYGDAAQCAGGVVIDTSDLRHIGPIDPASGSVDVGGGTSFDELIRTSLPLGWFVPVSPGTRHVTVGGAIASDVHGKNHHRDGSFCAHVDRLTLATPVGKVVCGPSVEPDLFWATAGGMGLTGVVTAATIRLIRVESSWMAVDTERFENLDDVMAAMESRDDAYRYSVAWVDCSGSGKRLGRSVLTRGDHLPATAIRGRTTAAAHTHPPRARFAVPFPAPRRTLSPSVVRAFNEIWFRRAPRREQGTPISLYSFFHPLDAIGRWNLLYGSCGFVQYQFVVGPHHEDVVREAISAIAAAGVPSFLAVLKRFGPGDPGPLSFPTEGWTLALDFPVGPSSLSDLLDDLDELVAGAGGRVYLAKDARLRPELLPVMYPRIGELVEIRRRVDPEGLVQSDLSRRLRLDRPPILS